MKKHIPNIITGLNLLLGSIAVIIAFYNIKVASYLILLAAVLDFLDGFLARVLNATSEFGRQFDSFADVISFGLAPSVIIFLLLLKSSHLPSIHIGSIYIFPFISMFIVLCASLRLVRFNLESSSTGFTGLPVPAAAIFFATLALMQTESNGVQNMVPFILNTYLLTSATAFISWLMISSVPMMSLKGNINEIQRNPYLLTLAAGTVILVIFLGPGGLAPAILFYIILSLFKAITGKEKQ